MQPHERGEHCRGTATKVKDAGGGQRLTSVGGSETQINSRTLKGSRRRGESRGRRCGGRRGGRLPVRDCFPMSGPFVLVWALLAFSTVTDAFLLLAATKRPLSPFQACALHTRRQRPVQAAAAGGAGVSGGGGRCTLASAEALMMWLDENGAVLDGISIEASPMHGLGAIATRSLEVGHVALLVPRHAQLLADSEALHTISGQLAERVAELLCSSASPAVAAKFEESSLAMALLSEVSLMQGNSRKCRGAADGPSHFAAYLESLPSMKDMSRAAWLWETDRLEAEVSTELASDARALRLQVGNEYLALAEAGATVLASGETMTEEQWLWGRAIVMSRGVDVFSGLALV